MESSLSRGAVWPGAAAVSGGGDSLALLFLIVEWAQQTGRPAPVVLTVDHGLSRDSARQAADVARKAGSLGVEAHILQWTDEKPLADIEAAARGARYGLLGAWCRDRGVGCLFVAHSMDDQAETFLLRLMRGSGVDGLSAMAEVAPFPAPGFENLRLARPLLGVQRARLRAFLSARGESWVEDEMNGDMRFARARLRAGWPSLQKLGLSAGRIAAAARHLARARSALDQDASDLLARASRTVCACVFLDGRAISSAPEEIGLRCLSSVLAQVSGQFYRPRFERLERLAAAIRSGELRGGRTLHGCCISTASRRDACFGPQTVRIAPEPGRRRRAAGGAQNERSFQC